MMKYNICSIFLLLLIHVLSSKNAEAAEAVCFVDTSRIINVDLALTKLGEALPFCNILICGFAGINAQTFHIEPPNGGINLDFYRAVPSLKRQHSHLRILLSVGGDHDVISESAESNKYLNLLENTAPRNAFISSAQGFMSTYGFDGLDLAWQFPKNPPKDSSQGVKKYWNKFLGLFKSSSVDKKSEQHKEEFVSFLGDLKSSLSPYGLMLTLTMLPHVSAELFIDKPRVLAAVDFVTLATFDFTTPERDGKVADYSAPYNELYERDPTHCVDYHVRYWLNNTDESRKIIMGIPAYGRAWTIKKPAPKGLPPMDAEGPAPAGNHTKIPGLLSWPEICVRMHGNDDKTGDEAPLRTILDATAYKMSYGYRSANDAGEFGMWISFDDHNTILTKAEYSRAMQLGGVALFDLTMDDADGTCGEGRYPILRKIRYMMSKVYEDED